MMQYNEQITGFVFCAGLGTRLRPLTLTTPKPLVEVHRRPLLEYILDWFRHLRITQVILNTHHLREQFRKYAGDHNHLHIELAEEEKILGHSGGLRAAADKITTPYILAVNGDSIMDFSEAYIDQGLEMIKSAHDKMIVIYIEHSAKDPLRFNSRNDLIGINDNMFGESEVNLQADALGAYLIPKQLLYLLEDNGEFMGFFGNDDFMEKVVRSGAQVKGVFVEDVRKVEITSLEDLERVNAQANLF